jgi:hypothetical protein
MKISQLGLLSAYAAGSVVAFNAQGSGHNPSTVILMMLKMMQSDCENIWLGGRDSNPDRRIQSPQSYR